MCHRRRFILLVVLAVPRIVPAQTPVLPHKDAPPQSARQALLEMVFARNPEEFFSHIPKNAQTLMKADANVLPLEELSQVAMQLQWPGRKLETFETGPVLLRSENSYSHQIVEVSVESETDGLDEDQLQLSVRKYRSGKVDPLPFLPTATFTMKTEDGIWRLHDISVNLRLPLGDKAFLDGLAPDRRPPHVEELESAAMAHLRALNTAQVSYAATFQDLGFACSVTNLGGSGEDEPTSSSAGLIGPDLSSGSLDGYAFSIEGCSGSPVDHFVISAVPENAQSGMRAFCSDESAAIRFSEDGSAVTCLSDGEPLP